jgi:hypothetical protein
VRALLIASAFLLFGCAAAVTVPRQPFNDIPIPVQWTPYSRESDFAKDGDHCRVTVIEGASVTHVDHRVARVTRPR